MSEEFLPRFVLLGQRLLTSLGLPGSGQVQHRMLEEGFDAQCS